MVVVMFKTFLQAYKHSDPLQSFVKYALLLVSVSVLFTIGIVIAEDYTWIDSTWLTFQTLTTIGYGDIPPSSIAGRTITIILSLMGLALFGTVIGGVFEINEFNKLQRRIGMKENPFTDGYVFVNFPGKVTVEYFLKEIRDKEPEAPLCIIDNELEELPKWLQATKNIHYIKGNTIQPETYERANIAKNKMVVVYPSNPGVSSSDALTAVIVDNVNKKKGPQTRVAHTIVDPVNRHLFEGKGSVQILEALEVLALVNECHDRYTAAAFERLLLNTEGANAVTVEKHAMNGISWSDFQKACIQASSEQAFNVNPFAIVRNGSEPTTNPAPNMVLEEDDFIILIADPGFSYPAFEEIVKQNL